MVKRRRVIGIALAFTGIVSSIMPYIIVILMNSYGVKGTILILGGLCLHSIPAAVLLQPVKWHMKEVDAKDHVEIEAKDKEAQKALLAAKGAN